MIHFEKNSMHEYPWKQRGYLGHFYLKSSLLYNGLFYSLIIKIYASHAHVRSLLHFMATYNIISKS